MLIPDWRASTLVQSADAVIVCVVVLQFCVVSSLFLFCNAFLRVFLLHLGEEVRFVLCLLLFPIEKLRDGSTVADVDHLRHLWRRGKMVVGDVMRSELLCKGRLLS